MHEAADQIARKIVADALGCPIEDVMPHASVGSLPQWDSIAHVSIIMAVEEKLGRAMTAAEIAAFNTVSNLASVFAEQKGQS